MNGTPLDAALLAQVAGYQRLGADTGASAWVSASAGSGKTRVLRDRVLGLLLAGVRPERILCLTFTKAAAAEMSRRINAELGEWTTLEDAALDARLAELFGRAVEPGERGRARQLFARVLDAPGGARIMTIHAFCQSVLRRFPLEAGVAPHFQVMEDRDSEEMLALVREDILAVGPEEDAALARAVAAVAVQVHEVNFPPLLRRLTADRAKIAGMLRASGGLAGATGRLARLLCADPEEGRSEILARACAEGAFDAAGLRALAAGLADGTEAERARAVAIGEWLAGGDEARRTGHGDYARVFLTQTGSVRKVIATKKTLEANPRLAPVVEAEADRLLALDEALRKAALFEAGCALITVGTAMLARYEARKRAAALIDYDDLIEHTRALLRTDGRAAWVLFKLDGGVDHILVDEAQDTNPAQWDVILGLADEFFSGFGARDEDNEARGLPPRSVFAVGDPKQSIYSFQGAEPDRFAAVREYLHARAGEAERAWHDVPLNFSFRSARDVLHAVDRVFALPDARAGVVGTGETLEHYALRTGMAGRVEVWPLAEPDLPAEQDPWKPPVERLVARGASEILAAAIAERIRDWIAKGEPLESLGRTVEPGDIMVLVRQRGRFVDALVRALKERGVAVAGVDRMVLSEQIAVMDLLALGQFLLLPDDDLTMATVLKSPLGGLDEDQLFALAHEREGASLWRTLAARVRRDPAFAAARDWLADLLGRVDYERPYELFAGVLARGGREALFGRLGPDAADPIDEFLSLALAYERHHTPSLQGFLHWMATGEAQVKRDLDQTRGAVRVMTVHGAKGLEAPIVFLPDTTQVPRMRDNLFWGDDRDGRMLVWLPRAGGADAVATDIREQARRAQEEEYRRLLYVAMTRAEERLYVCGWGEAAEGSWYAMVRDALEPVAEAVADDTMWTSGLTGGAAVLRLASAQRVPVEAGAGEAAPVAPPPLPGWAARPAPDEPDPPRPLAPSRREDEPPARSPLDAGEDFSRFRRGTILHHLLQWLPSLPHEARAAAARRYLARPALALDEGRRATLWEEARAVLDEPGFAALFGPDSIAEVAVTGLVRDRGGRPQAVSGQIDRLVVTDTSVLIVDYKSNRPPPETPEAVPPVYLRQMALYRALIRATWPDRAVEACLLWTDGPRLMPLPDALLDGYAPADGAGPAAPAAGSP